MATWRFENAPKAFGSVYWEDVQGAYTAWVTLLREPDGWVLYEGMSDEPLTPETLPAKWREIVLRRSTPQAYLDEIRVSGYPARMITPEEIEEQAESE